MNPVKPLVISTGLIFAPFLFLKDHIYSKIFKDEFQNKNSQEEKVFGRIPSTSHLRSSDIPDKDKQTLSKTYNKHSTSAKEEPKKKEIIDNLEINKLPKTPIPIDQKDELVVINTKDIQEYLSIIEFLKRNYRNLLYYIIQEFQLKNLDNKQSIVNIISNSKEEFLSKILEKTTIEDIYNLFLKYLKYSLKTSKHPNFPIEIINNNNLENLIVKLIKFLNYILTLNKKDLSNTVILDIRKCADTFFFSSPKQVWTGSAKGSNKLEVLLQRSFIFREHIDKITPQTPLNAFLNLLGIKQKDLLSTEGLDNTLLSVISSYYNQISYKDMLDIVWTSVIYSDNMYLMFAIVILMQFLPVFMCIMLMDSGFSIKLKYNKTFNYTLKILLTSELVITFIFDQNFLEAFMLFLLFAFFIFAEFLNSIGFIKQLSTKISALTVKTSKLSIISYKFLESLENYWIFYGLMIYNLFCSSYNSYRAIYLLELLTLFFLGYMGLESQFYKDILFFHNRIKEIRDITPEPSGLSLPL